MFDDIIEGLVINGIGKSLDNAKTFFEDVYSEKAPVEGTLNKLARKRAYAKFIKAIEDAKRAEEVVKALSVMDKKS